MIILSLKRIFDFFFYEVRLIFIVKVFKIKDKISFEKLLGYNDHQIFKKLELEGIYLIKKISLFKNYSFEEILDLILGYSCSKINHLIDIKKSLKGQVINLDRELEE